VVYYIPLLYLKENGYLIDVIEKLDKEFVKISSSHNKEFRLCQIADKVGMNELDTFKLISLCIQKKLVMIVYRSVCPICNKTAKEMDSLVDSPIELVCDSCGNNITVEEKDMKYTFKLLLGAGV